MKYKNILLLFFNIIIPLFCGLMIYVFMKSGTYINTFLNLDFQYKPTTVLEIFIINWFCDFLWSYALVFALFLVLNPFKRRLIISALIPLAFGPTLEFLQKINVLSGTFDWWDIVIECFAVIIATLFIKKISKKDGS